MHEASMRLMKGFLEKYNLVDDKLIVDVGSLDVNGSYRELLGTSKYYGTDMRRGRNVDFVVGDVVFRAFMGRCDAFMCGQVLEHAEFPVELAINCKELLKPNGLGCFIAPSRMGPHNHPHWYGDYSLEKMQEVMLAADFEILELYLDPEPMTMVRANHPRVIYLNDVFCVVRRK